MQRIGVRELRQHASVWLRRVREGESFEVTARGRTVALLIPPPESNGIEVLIEAGRARAGEGSLLSLGPPLPASQGRPLPSEVLERLRDDER